MNDLVELAELIDKKFIIPSYQRGYRWQAQYEVKTLLEDLLEFFTKEDENSPNYYCLQPLVVQTNKKYPNSYNVLDGQQRLTTFFLIYKALSNTCMFSLQYETREKSDEFLQHIENEPENKKNENIDFYHIYEAFSLIKEWMFSNSQRISEFKEKFLHKAKVIWYEVPEEEKEIDVFLRLNVGKIPLTNAELIKALFLTKEKNEPENILRQRAALWYQCELQTRQDNDKAYCLFNNIQKEDIIKNSCELSDDIMRIEMYFSLLSNKKNTQQEPHAIFKKYYQLLQTKNKKILWNEFKDCQEELLGIARPEHDDISARKLYHYIGFLINSGTYTINDFWSLLKELESIDKISDILKGKIKKIFLNVALSDLSYLTDAKKLSNILLLFNLIDLNNKEANQKDFEFNRFKMQQWSLEHIIPQSIKNINDESGIEEWLKDIEALLPQCHEQIALLIQKIRQPKDKNEKNSNILLLKKELEESSFNIHGIGNLVLLDKNSNSMLGNSNFSKKREKIYDLHKTNILIPQCTWEVFEKVYSQEKGKPTIWTDHDAKMYFEKIQNTLAEYIKE